MSDDPNRPSSSRRSKRRSLRVPVDEVPRRVSTPEPAPAAAPPAPSAPPRPRTVPPPPPPMARATDPSIFDPFGEPPEKARTTDPGETPAEALEETSLAEIELGAPIEGAEAKDELESEPTNVLVPGVTRAASSRPPPPPPREVETSLESAELEAAEVEELAASPTVMVPTHEVEGAPAPVEESSQPMIEVGPASEETQEAAPAPVPSSTPPGPILVQRTIAIGVGAPTHTTLAKERESQPPPSLPAVEISESEIALASDAEREIVVEAEAPAPPEEREEQLEELEVVPDAGGPRSAPPPPPGGPPAAAATAAAPPPPPRDRPPPPPKAPPSPPAAAPAPAPAAVEVDTGKRVRKKWWEEFFNDDYFRTVPPPQPRTIVAQSAFIAARLGLPPGASILDVGCGLGLHAIELTRLGYTVVGLDLSLPMLTRAADEAQDQGLKINFVQGDMREMAFESLFDAVLCWGTTFGYFDDDQNRLVVERLHRALKPGGLLLLDVVNRDYVFKTQPNNVWFQGDGCIVMEESNANFINSRLTVKRQVMLDDGRQNETVYSVRLYSLHELGQLLHQRGFRVVQVSGREATPGVFFGAESPRLIITAERRPEGAPSKRPDGEPPGAGESQQLPAIRE